MPEAEQLIRKVNKIIEDQRGFDYGMASSMGILSPFRNQSELLHDLLLQTATPEDIEKHKLKVGTPYSFQGDERDMMFISFCVDDDSHASAFNYLNTSEMFNVAVTRAKFNQYIFSSVFNTSSDNLITKYLSSFNSKKKAKNQKDDAVYDEFLDEVVQYLKEKTGEVHIDYLVAGILVDILVHSKKGYFGIDLIGYPGKFYKAQHIDHYEILGRAGVKMVPLPYSNWYYDKAKCVEGISRLVFGS